MVIAGINKFMSILLSILTFMKYTIMSILDSLLDTIPATVWAGIVGAISRAIIGPKRTFGEYISGIIVGIGASIYIAPIIAPTLGLELSDSGTLAIAYVTGTIGANIVDSIVRTGKKILEDPTAFSKSPIISAVLDALANKNKSKNDEPK